MTQWFCPNCNHELSAGKLKIVTPRDLMDAVVNEVALAHGIEPKQLRGHERTRALATARHEAIRAIHSRYPNLSSVHIGTFFGLDHSSILYAFGNASPAKLRAKAEKRAVREKLARLQQPRSVPTLDI